MATAWLAFGAALLLGLALTALVRRVAVRARWLAPPRADRWHAEPTPRLGGVAIFFAWLVPATGVAAAEPALRPAIAGSALVFGLGLADDLVDLRPLSKLVCEIAIAAGVLLASPAGSAAATLLLVAWLVAATNAFNLLDNMDGLSAGIAAIAALWLAVAAALAGNVPVATLAAGLCGGALGFLRHNLAPARIFMGDSGSLFLGFTLAALAADLAAGHDGDPLLALLVPALVLAAPLFDATFVTVTRVVEGRPILQGGRDHVSHRLVAAGLSERTTVALFYLLGLGCGGIALVGLRRGMLYPSLATALIVVVLGYFGVLLAGRGAPLRPTQSAASRFAAARARGRAALRARAGALALDALLVALAFPLAFAVRFDGIPPGYLGAIARALPILVPLKLAVFAGYGLYRDAPPPRAEPDLAAVARAVSASSILAVATVALVYRLEEFPRAVFAIDWMLLLLAVSTGRSVRARRHRSGPP